MVVTPQTTGPRKPRIASGPFKRRPKPEYGVLSLEEISNSPKSSGVAVSTFSGAGGSCLGLEMAGFDVRWASEFVPAAQIVYRKNHPKTYLDVHDIRNVSSDAILDRIGVDVGEVDLLEGSPPCASFSTAGKREKYWGEIKKYSDTHQRTDDLFFEFVRIVDGLRPKVFLAENVQGLLIGVAKGYFREVLRAMRDAGGEAGGYRVEARLLDARYLGVPQTRPRVIFMGVREDLKRDPVFPKPLKHVYTYRDAVPEMEIDDGLYRTLKEGHKLRRLWEESDPAKGWSGAFEIAHERLYGKRSAFTHHRVHPDKPVSTLDTSCTLYHPTSARTLSISEAKRVSSFPDDFDLSAAESFVRQWERLARSVPPLMMQEIARAVRDEVLYPCAA